MRYQNEVAPISKDDCIFFGKFLTEYGGFILHSAQKYQRPGIEVEDILQEARLRLLLKIDDLRTFSRNKTLSYIRQAVYWAFLDLYRAQARHSYVSMDSVLEEMLGTERDLVPDLFLRLELQRLRQQLTPQEWSALKSKYIYGYSQEELGKWLDMKPNSVRMFLHRLRKRARQILSSEKVAGGDFDD